MSCSAQVKIAMRDVSGRHSPIRVSGAISFEDKPGEAMRYTYRLDGSVKNASRKAALLIVIHFTDGGVNAPGLDYVYSDERFFGPDELKSGESEPTRCGTIPMPVSYVNGVPVDEDVGPNAIPFAKSEVLFVQFADGTTWGDAKQAHMVLGSRVKTRTELGRLRGVLGEHGEEALTDQLSKDAQSFEFPCIGGLFNECERKKADCLVQGLHAMINAADRHQEGLNVDQ